MFLGAPPGGPCTGIPFLGTCPGSQQGWTYKELSGRCEVFFWGRCQTATRNNYVSKESCEGSCGGGTSLYNIN